MAYDYSLAAPPRDFDLIPHGTIATLRIKIRAGGVGEDAMLKRASTGAEMLDIEFAVVDGEFKHRKFWTNLVLQGHTDGHAKAAEISRGVLRTIIESALGIKRDDMSSAGARGPHS